MSNAESVTLEYDKLNKLKGEIKILKDKYKDAKEKSQIGLVSEEDKKIALQQLLEKEYEYGKIKDSIANRNGTYESPKVGNWIVTKGKFGFKRIKVEKDEFCGW